MNIADEENNNDDTGGGEQNSVRNTCCSPGGQLPTDLHTDNDDVKDKSEIIARLPQSNAVHCEKPLLGDNCKVRPSGQERKDKVELNALNGSSAPSLDDEESWANEITAKAQLVATRVLQRESDRFVKLSNMDQALWPCVGRRITNDLETGEVIADEDVTRMREHELRRPLDKPRKLRVEFYSQTSSSWADQLDE